jgi:hypothetical protein
MMGAIPRRRHHYVRAYLPPRPCKCPTHIKVAAALFEIGVAPVDVVLDHLSVRVVLGASGCCCRNEPCRPRTSLLPRTRFPFGTGGKCKTTVGIQLHLKVSAIQRPGRS